jgi:hypothetical protein
MIAKNIIEDDESAIVIITAGTHLKIFESDFANTGNSVLDKIYRWTKRLSINATG